jgi:diacylglycerol kinase family enzyme
VRFRLLMSELEPETGTHSMSADTVLIAANPKAGWSSRERHLAEMASQLRARGLSVEIVTELNRAESLANGLHAVGRLRALVAAGGDGTLAELLHRTLPGTPLAIYPCGTANLVARYFGITRQVSSFVAMLLEDIKLALDAGRANGRLFLAICSCGFDAEVVRRMHATRTGNISSLAYAMPMFSAFASYPFPDMKITVGGGAPNEAIISAKWVFVSNLPCYAMGLQPGAGATGEDGLLDLCAFTRGGLLSVLRYVPALLRGAQRDLTDCLLRRASRFRVESIDSEIPYELDGDPGGLLPVEIDVLPGRLTLLVPKAFADQRATS